MKLEQLCQSMTRDAVYTYDFDVTTGIVEQDIIGTDGTNYTAQRGLEIPCRFDDLIRRYFEQEGQIYFLADSSITELTSETLRRSYQSGRGSVEVSLYYPGRQKYERVTCYLYEESDHIRAYVVCRDITGLENEKYHSKDERNSSLENQVQKQEHYYKEIMDIEECGLIAYELPEHKITHVNAKALQTYGYASQEELQPHFFDVINAIHFLDPSVPEKLAMFQKTDNVLDYEFIIYEGQERECHAIAKSEILHAPNGKRVVVTTFLNISEVKVLKQMLESAEQAKNEAVLENEIISSISKMYFAIFRIDLTKNYYEEISSDSSVHKLTGHEGNAQEKMEELCMSFVSGEHRQEIREFFDLSTLPDRLQDLETVEAQYHATDGSWHEARFIVKKRDEDAVVTHVLYVTRIISALKQKELEQQEALKSAFAAAEQANEAKTTFLNNMSHDIRTPMNGIIGMTAIAEAHLDDPSRVKECLQKISGASNHLLALINEVLDVSRIESGRVSLAEEEFSLPDHMDNMVNMIAPQLNAKQQKFSITVSNIIHEKVIGDPARLQQVFMNIVGNAVKYTQEGGHIEVQLKELTSDNLEFARYQFICIDDGYGMKKNDLEKLFEPFERSEDEEIRKIQGTGLGMVITRNIVRMMDGDIRAESEYHKGSRFEVTFRLKKQKEEIEAYQELKDLTVLLVEDDTLSRESTFPLLKEMGMKVETAASGQEALEKVRAMAEKGDEFQCYMIDWKLPDLDGVETTKQIRSLTKINAPVFLFSSADWTDIEMEARAAGVDDFISKPLFRSKIYSKFLNLTGRDQLHPNGDKLQMFEKMDYSDKRILLVEDNELNREIAVEIIKMTGAQVEEAENGEIALHLFEQSRENYYDLILMDIQMPVMDGRQATQAIRNLKRPDAAGVPIVAMSANAFVEDMKSSIRAGMNEHIAKPINFEKLMGIMEKYLGNRTKQLGKTDTAYAENKKARILPARYYEELYLTNGSTVITEENQKACLDVLDKNGAVGIFGLLEQKDYPIYCVSGFALTSLGYTFEELLEATKGKFINLVQMEDRKRLAAEFYDKEHRHKYHMLTKDGRVVSAYSYATDTFVMDGSKVRMLSLHIENN